MTQVNTRLIIPHPVLQPYIRCFAIRKFDTEGNEFSKAILADHEMTMVFFLHSKLYNFKAANNKVVPYVVNKNGFYECCYTGIQKNTKGFVVFKGPTTLLHIHFKPVGFLNIFNVSPKELIDKLGDVKDILSNEILLLHEQMHYLPGPTECVSVLEDFLIKKLLYQKQKHSLSAIVTASEFLVQQNGCCSIRKLATQCNMTLQTFEVQFLEQVGTSPKLFSRLLKFGLAVNTKLYQPLKSWREIAYMFGYYDQTHFIKEFKEFALLCPTAFMKIINPPVENFG